MRADQFRRRVDRRPWRPFEIVLESGARIPVRHPENIIFAWDGLILAKGSNGEAPWFFEAPAVGAVRDAPVRRRRH